LLYSIKHKNMSPLSPLLQNAYSPEQFRQQAHELVDVLADYLSNVESRKETKAIPYELPEHSLEFWENDFEEGIVENPISFFKTILEKNTRLHHPRYMGHQVGVVAPLAATTSMLTALMNNGMAVYEMGLAANPLEKIVSDVLARRIGWKENYNGLLTSGGTLANLTALLTARAKCTAIWEEGTTEKLAVIVSEEAHYCIDRAARIMGMGNEGIIKIPVNNKFQMRTDLLEAAYENATAKGLRVIAIVGSCCSTSTGSYDDLIAIGTFAKKYHIWFHADGAHGAAVIFSEKYKYLVNGIELADSVVIDWHKMLMVPALATALLFKDENDAYQTFHQKAQYLWSNQSSKDWFNSGKRTFECTKYMMPIKIYVLLKTYGEAIFTDYVNYLYDLGKHFGTMITNHSNFELAVVPESNIVCFRFLSKDSTTINDLNNSIRKHLLEDGKFYIVQTTIKEQVYLRVSLMNPLTTVNDLKALLENIEMIVTKNSLSIA
jgi:L-2,4-diaminobutyrate decarboxylase